MEWTIEIGAGVCHHFDSTDLKFRSRRIAIARLLPRKVVADNRSRQTLVGDHAIFDRMAYVDQIECVVHSSLKAALPPHSVVRLCLSGSGHLVSEATPQRGRRSLQLSKSVNGKAGLYHTVR